MGSNGKRRKKPPDTSYEDLRQVLESARASGSEPYPMTVGRLFELAGMERDPAAMSALASRPSASRHVRISAKQNQSASTYARALAFLPDDVDRVAGSDQLLRHVLELVTSKSSNVFPIGVLAGQLPAFIEKAFGARVRERVEREDLPSAVGILRTKGHPILFLMDDIRPRRQPAPARPVEDRASSTGDFASELERAFQRLDQESGSHNYVLLHDLRQALPHVSRGEFDQRLNELRRAKRFSLDSADGRHVRLTPEQLEAGIREVDSLLVYVARR